MGSTYMWYNCQVFFFFHAEDGIRDGTVTGVQTCALPILGASSGDRGLPAVISYELQASACAGDNGGPHPTAKRARVQAFANLLSCGGRARAAARSEERRVGKECRSRWWPSPSKEKSKQ